jgi:hypothetical protein
MPPRGRINPKSGKPWTAAEDRAYDRAHGIKEGSPADNRLDRRRGVPVVIVAVGARRPKQAKG